MTTRRAGVILSILILLATTPPAFSDQDPSRDTQEASILSEIPAIAHRDKDALFIVLSDGQNRVYQDQTAACAADDVEHCLHYELVAYDAPRKVLVLRNTYYEWYDYRLISLESGDSIIVEGDPQGALDGRPYWASVDDGEYGSGDIKMVALESGLFRTLGEIDFPHCKFDRWDTDLAFFVLCWGERRGEFRVKRQDEPTLQVSRTSRTVSDEEYRAIGIEP